MMPERVQLRRTKGWRKPDNTVVVARPSKWGNPFIVGAECQVSTVDADGLFNDLCCTLTREQAVELYRADVEARLREWPNDHPDDINARAEFMDDLAKLRGKNLACWCPLVDSNGNRVPCHADVLLEVANS